MDPALMRAARVFKALAHPCRLRLLLVLSQEQICDVTKLIGVCGRRQPYVSQQLRVLRASGLVVGIPHGRRMCYQLATPEVVDLLAAIGLLDRSMANHERIDRANDARRALAVRLMSQGRERACGRRRGQLRREWDAGGRSNPAPARCPAHDAIIL